jgi:hypothetical protein
MAFFEIAVEPAAIHTLRDLQLVLSYIGFGKGRLIAGFPSVGPGGDRNDGNWASLIIESVKEHQIGKAQQVRELLISERRKILRSHRVFDHATQWIDNARVQHASKPFGAIIAAQSSDEEIVCCLDDFAGAKCPACLREDQHVRPLSKTPASFADALMPMLACAKELRFIDPWFLKLSNEGHYRVSAKHGNVVKEIAARLRLINRVPQVVEFHCLHSGGGDPAEKANSFAQEMGACLPNSGKARAFLWGEKLGGTRFHARYILTDVGGTGSEYGLDQGNSPGDETDFYLLPDPLREQRIKDFSAEGDAFDLVAGPVNFTGSRG